MTAQSRSPKILFPILLFIILVSIGLGVVLLLTSRGTETPATTPTTLTLQQIMYVSDGVLRMVDLTTSVDQALGTVSADGENPLAAQREAVAPGGRFLARWESAADQWTLFITEQTADTFTTRSQTAYFTENPSLSWSADGVQLAFAAQVNRDAAASPVASSELLILNAESGEVRQVTQNAFADDAPMWSNTAPLLAYIAAEDGTPRLYTLHLETNERRLLTPALSASNPTWSPSGEYIAFVSEQAGNADVYIVRADGSDLRALTTAPTNDTAPVWVE